MKKILYLIITALIILLHQGITNSQSRLSLQVFGGFSIPAGNFGQKVPLLDTSRAIWPYQLRSAFSFGARGKFALHKDRKINVTFGLNYTSFSNSQPVVNIYATTSGGPVWGDRSGIGGTSTVTFHPKVNIITIAGGLDYNFAPKAKLSPFADAEITVNFFSGSFSFDETSQGIYAPVDLASATRVGLQLGGGVEYNINENWGVLGGLRLNFANVLGKTSPQEDLHTQQLELGDKSGSVYGAASPTMNIAYISFFVGVQLYLKPQEKEQPPPGK